jgi:CMP-N-acetylneuraminic acid synthetase
MKKIIKRIRFIKHNKKSHKEIKNDIKPYYQDNVNYYIEYWKMYYENEYILAKIKETVYEIDSMQSHIEKLKEIKHINTNEK